MTFNLGLGDIAAVIGIVSALGTAAMAFMLGKGKDLFATKDDFSALKRQVDDMQRTIGKAVTHDDLGEMFIRMGKVETAVAVASEQVSGVREGVARMERQLSMLVQAQIEREQRRPRQGGAA